MRLIGTILQDGKWLVPEVSALDIQSQAKTMKQAYTMIKEAIELMADVEGAKNFKVSITPLENNQFLVESNGENVLFGLSIKRLRQKANLDQLELAKAIGLKSATTIGRYERFEIRPKQDQYSKILKALNQSVSIRLGA